MKGNVKMSIVTMKQLLDEAKQKNYAVGAFDTMDEITTEAILQGAEEVHKPVILMVVPPCVNPKAMPNAEGFMRHVVDRCSRSTVPVAIHLDHAPTFEDCMRGIKYGCTSVMFDGSSYPLEKNIAITKKVLEVARACGVTVEAEIGHVAGHEGNMLDGNVADPSCYTSVEEAIRFYQETDVDCLAVAIGTVHGVYKGTPHIDYDRLDEIKKAIPIPIVLHGGSGLFDEDYIKLVAHGINKINFFTAMTLAGANAVKEFAAKTPKFQAMDVLNVLGSAEKEIVKHHIGVFGTLPVSPVSC